MSDVTDIVSAMGGYQAATPQDKLALEAQLATRGGRQRTSGGAPTPTPSPGLRSLGIMGTNLEEFGLSFFSGTWPAIDRSKLGEFQNVNGGAAPVIQASGYPSNPNALLMSVEGEQAADGVTKRYVFLAKSAATFTFIGSKQIGGETSKNGFRRFLLDMSQPNGAILTGAGGHYYTRVECSGYGPTDEAHLVREDQEDLFFAGEVWNPEFIRQTQFYGGVRLMDWFKTNDRAIASWATRKPLSAPCWSSSMPIEAGVALANKLGEDFYLDVPVDFNDADVRSLAVYVRDNLRSDLRCHVEYGNELWNFQLNYFNTKSPTITGTFQPWGWAGYRMAQVMAIFGDVFGSDFRLRRVFAPQQANLQTRVDFVKGVQFALNEWGTVGNNNYNATFADRYRLGMEDLFEEGAITTYFAGSVNSPDADTSVGAPRPNKATVESWAADNTDAGLTSFFSQLRFADQFTGGSADDLAHLKLTYAEYASWFGQYNLDLIAYEGGPHLNTLPVWGGDPKADSVFSLFKRASVDPRMGTMIRDVCTAFVQAGGVAIYNFNQIRLPDLYGTFGAKEYLTQAATPRSAALEAFNTSSLPIPELTVTVETTGSFTVGANPLSVIKATGGVGRKRYSIDTFAGGRALRGRRINGVLTTEQQVTSTITVIDEATPPNVKTFALVQDVKPMPVGKRVFRLRMTATGGAGNQNDGYFLPQLSDIRFYDAQNALISMNGVVVTSNKSISNPQNLVDNNPLTWPDFSQGAGAADYILTLPAGSAAKPVRVELQDRADLPERAPVDFSFAWGDDATTMTVLKSVTGATYTGHVYAFMPDY